MNRLTTDSEDVEPSPWIQGVQVVEPPSHECQAGAKGPTYKVDLEVFEQGAYLIMVHRFC